MVVTRARETAKVQSSLSELSESDLTDLSDLDGAANYTDSGGETSASEDAFGEDIDSEEKSDSESTDYGGEYTPRKLLSLLFEHDYSCEPCL